MNRPGAAESFDAVVRLFEAGQTIAAAEMCGRLLEKTPGDVSLRNMLGVIAAQEGRFADAAACFRAVAAIAPDDPGVVTNLAQALLECGEHTEALALFRRAVGADLKLFRSGDLDVGKPALDVPRIHRLNDVTVETGYWAVLDGEKIYTRETSNLNMVNSPAIKGRITTDREFAVLSVPAISQTIDEPCLFVGGDGNYAHWIYRYLMRLAALDERPDLAALPLLVGDDIRPYEAASLAMAGFADNRLIRVPRRAAVRCRDIHLPVCLWSTPGRISHGIHWLRRRALEAGLVSPDPGTRRLFISRRDAPSRKMTNEDEVVHALAPLGFKSVELSTLGFAEQVSLFGQAEIVVAPHGAGLANIIFAPAACRLVELVSDPIAHMSDIRVIQEAIGQRGMVVPCTSYEIYPGATHPMIQHSFRTEPADVVAAVETTLAGPG